MKSIAIVIHARKDSTRCPNKHLRDLGDGSTLIDIAINNVQKLDNVDEKYLAAYDQELKDKAYGKIEILNREYDSVAPGNAHHSVMYRHLKNVKADYIINYNPCQPFLDIDKLQKIINWFKETPEVKSAITVRKIRNWFWDDNGKPINFKPGDRLSTTGGPSVIEATHSLVFYEKAYMLENWELFPNTEHSPEPILLDDWPEEELLDVDTELDFTVVKEVYNKRNRMTVDKWRTLQSKNEKSGLAIDFDGVIHRNSLGYKDGTVYDTPVEGAIEAIKVLAQKHTITLYTFKGHPDRPLIDGKDGIELTWEWLEKYGLKSYIKDIVWGKPNAQIYIDDKGYRFIDWKSTIKYINENL